jgi:hypothetical protein
MSGLNMFLIWTDTDVEVDGDRRGGRPGDRRRARLDRGGCDSTLRAATNVRAVAILASSLDTGEIVALRRHREEMS